MIINNKKNKQKSKRNLLVCQKIKRKVENPLTLKITLVIPCNLKKKMQFYILSDTVNLLYKMKDN